MTTSVNQPNAFDAVLGGQAIAPSGSVVLGGLEGIRRRLSTGKVEERVAAVWDAPNYGQAGLELIIRALGDRSLKVQKVAYRLLRDRSEVQAHLAVQAYCPYPLFECLAVLEGHQAGITAIAIATRQWRYRADQPIAVSASRDGMIYVWDLEAQAAFLSVDAAALVYAIAIDPETDSFTIRDEADQLQAWSLKNGQVLEPTCAKLRTIASVQTVGDREYLISGSKASIKIWALATGKELIALSGHTSLVSAIAISQGDRPILVSGSEDKTIRLWGL